MNQFHTPSFGDEVFELTDTPAESQSPSQAVSGGGSFHLGSIP